MLKELRGRLTRAARADRRDEREHDARARS
jgi:hypothetical protein